MPPRLDAALRRNYPRELAARGIAGHAVVKVSLEANGKVSAARVRSESQAGFGSACALTLLDSEWSAPRDRSGAAVRTELTYRCRFEVN